MPGSYGSWLIARSHLPSDKPSISMLSAQRPHWTPILTRFLYVAIRMRLLDTETWEMRYFIADDEVPAYVILSHKWEKEEVSFYDWENQKLSTSNIWLGSRKSRHSARRPPSAGSGGFELTRELSIHRQ
jgi:hypothetical protein